METKVTHTHTRTHTLVLTHQFGRYHNIPCVASLGPHNDIGQCTHIAPIPHRLLPKHRWAWHCICHSRQVSKYRSIMHEPPLDPRQTLRRHLCPTIIRHVLRNEAWQSRPGLCCEVMDRHNIDVSHGPLRNSPLLPLTPSKHPDTLTCSGLVALSIPFWCLDGAAAAPSAIAQRKGTLACVP